MSCRMTSSGVYGTLQSSKSLICGSGWQSVVRQPTDPLFYASITLQNVLSGSRYWIAQASNLSNVLATGTAPGGDIVIAGIPAVANPMLVEVRVRFASGTTKYQPLTTYGYLSRSGVVIYVAQVEDTVAELS